MRMRKSHLKKALFVTCFFFSTLLPWNNAQAKEELSLTEAVAWGLGRSPSLVELKESAETAKRQMEKVKADLNWRADLSGQVSTGNKSGGQTGQQREQTQAGVDIEGSRSYLWGMSIKPSISLKTNLSAPQKDDPKTVFSLNINQRLYPQIATPKEKEFYSAHKSWEKAETNLKWQMEGKKIDWLEGYLNLLRQEEKMKVARERFLLAQEELENTIKRRQIGESGEQQELAAEINLKKAEYALKQAVNNLAEGEEEWRLMLGLPAGKRVTLVEEDPYFSGLQNELEDLSLDWDDSQSLMAMVIENHQQIILYQLDREKTLQELKWQEEGRKPEITTGAGYEYPDQLWSLSLNLTYNLWDGGRREIEDQERQASLEALDRKYDDLVEDLRLQLTQLLNRHSLAELREEEEELQLKKALLEKEVFQKQQEAGLLSRKDWDEKHLEYVGAEINRKDARDKVFISKLRILHFIGMILIP